jgi:hypothetical protein
MTAALQEQNFVANPCRLQRVRKADAVCYIDDIVVARVRIICGARAER